MLQLRYLGIKHRQFEMPCVCISGDTEPEALDIADMALRYYEARGAKLRVSVGFKLTAAGTFDFLLEFGATGIVDIRGVASSIPARVVSGLEFFEGFFILLAFGHHNLSLIDLHTFHILHSELNLDGRIVRGTRKVEVDCHDLLERGFHRERQWRLGMHSATSRNTRVHRVH